MADTPRIPTRAVVASRSNAATTTGDGHAAARSLLERAAPQPPSGFDDVQARLAKLETLPWYSRTFRENL